MNTIDAIKQNIILSDIDEDTPSEINVNLETNEQYILVSTT